MTDPIRDRRPPTPRAPQNPPPAPQKKIEVTLGERTTSIIVQPENERRLETFLADGDLTNDLARIAKADGDPALTAGDFVASGFAETQSRVLAEMARYVRAYHVDPAALAAGDWDHIASIVRAKEYLITAIGAAAPNGASLAPRIEAHYGALPPAVRNAGLAGIAHDAAMLNVRASERGAGGIREPDMPLNEKHELLEQRGVTDRDERTRQIEAVRREQLTAIRAEAQRIYRALGGEGEIGETITLATGSGVGTVGLAGGRNSAIGFMDYGAPSGPQPAGSDALPGLRELEKKFVPTDMSRPVTIQLGVFAADEGFAGNTITLTRNGADGRTHKFELDVFYRRGRTVLEPRDPAQFETHARFDPRAQTITFPAGPEPITVRQRSGASGGELDEIALTLSAVNASSEAPNLTVELRELFDPGRFDFTGATTDALAKADAQVDAAAAYLTMHPETRIELELAARGPTGFDGARPALELDGYGPEGDAFSRENTVDLRSSRLTVKFREGNVAQISVDATTDPVRAALSHGLGAKGRTLVAQIRARDPAIGDNDVLSALRAFAIAELLQSKLHERGVSIELIHGMSVRIGNTRVSEDEYRSIRAQLRAR